MSQQDAPGAAAVAGFLLTLFGAALWLSMLLGPVAVVTGLTNVREGLVRAERNFGRGREGDAIKATYSARAAAESARRGAAAGAPLLHLVRAVPRLERVVDVVPALIAAGDHSTRAAVGSLEIAVDAVSPESGFITNDEEGARIRLERIDDIATTVEGVEREVAAAETALVGIERRGLPRRVRRGIKEGLARTASTQDLIRDLEAGLAILPRILGADEPRIYMLGIQNSAELRGTGGAILQYAFLSLDRGRADLLKASSVYDVDVDRRRIDVPLPKDAWYVAGIPDAQRFGNANWSPDWPLSSRLTIRYARAAERRFRGIKFPDRIDGVIAVDPITMKNLIPAVGSYRIKAGPRIQATTVVNFLLHNAYAKYPGPERRRAVLRQVVDEFYRRLLRGRRPALLLRGFGESLAGKHMQVWLADPNEQQFVERMDWDGSIRAAPRSDYLYVVEQNVGGNKLDYHAEQRHEVRIRPRGNDVLVSTRVEVHNRVFLPQPSWALGDTGPRHMPMINVYARGGATLTGWSAPRTCPEEIASTAPLLVCRNDNNPPPAAWIDGRPAEHRERGKKVWSGTLHIPARKTAALRFDYRVPRVIQKDGQRSVYRIVVQHQPKVRPEKLVLRFELPVGATEVKAPGWVKRGRTLLWQRVLDHDVELEVSWRS